MIRMTHHVVDQADGTIIEFDRVIFAHIQDDKKSSSSGDREKEKRVVETETTEEKSSISRDQTAGVNIEQEMISILDDEETESGSEVEDNSLVVLESDSLRVISSSVQFVVDRDGVIIGLMQDDPVGPSVLVESKRPLEINDITIDAELRGMGLCVGETMVMGDRRKEKTTILTCLSS